MNALCWLFCHLRFVSDVILSYFLCLFCLFASSVWFFPFICLACLFSLVVLDINMFVLVGCVCYVSVALMSIVSLFAVVPPV